MRHTQFAICSAWLARTYRHNNNPYTVERSPDHVRYLFHYLGDAVPFFTLHSLRDEGTLRQFSRVNGEPVLKAIGYPFVVMDTRGDRILARVWNGEYWDLQFLSRAEVEPFTLFLSCGSVGVTWGTVCQ